jgi:uncharacterized membrane protein HdeD (DUF308 family)
MDDRLSSDAWGGLAFRGMLAVLFGIAAIFWPGITLGTLVYLFGAFILASGLISLITGLTNINNRGATLLPRVLMILLGVLEIGAGVYLIRHPLLTFTTFILLAGFALIIRGVIDVFAGLFEADGAMYKTTMILSGLIGVIAGIFVLFQPAASGVAFVWILGLYALISGALLIALALDVKNNSVPGLNGRTVTAKR